MTHQVSRDELYATGPQRIYWWHLPVRPDKAASLGRDMIVSIFAWLFVVMVLLTIIDLLVVTPG